MQTSRVDPVALRSAWGDFLGRYNWEFMTTLTFDPKRRSNVDARAALRGAVQWCQSLTRQLGEEAGWVATAEFSPGERWHAHVLLIGVPRKRASLGSRMWLSRNGFTKITPVHSPRSACLYVTKQAALTGDIEISDSLLSGLPLNAPSVDLCHPSAPPNRSSDQAAGANACPAGGTIDSRHESGAARRCTICDIALLPDEPVWRTTRIQVTGPYRRRRNRLCFSCVRCTSDRCRHRWPLSPCLSCGRPIGVRPSCRSFCSDQCRGRFYSLRRKAERQMQRNHAASPCLGCGLPFERVRSDQKTCSAACRQRVYRRRLAIPDERVRSGQESGAADAPPGSEGGVS